jgi:hypothetical protein
MHKRSSFLLISYFCSYNLVAFGYFCRSSLLTKVGISASYHIRGMKSIKKFFPTVESSGSNKRQKTSKTTFTAVSEDRDKQLSDDTLSEPTTAVAGPAKSETIVLLSQHVDEIPPVVSVPLLGWQPFDEMEISWKRRLYPEFSKPYFQRLLKFLEDEIKSKTVFPPSDQIFTALNLCPYDKVKVVVVGQDPYHGPGQAHGLAFSVQKGVAIPPSLKNMINEAHNDPEVHIPKPTHGNLEHWSRQGVLMLNAVLTVRKAEANSHQKKG